MPPNEDLTTLVLYKDPMALVINKPAGLSVHAGPSGGQNLEAGLDALRFGAKDMPLLAHRLDRDTAGCLALGRGPKGIKRLGRLFREGVVGKVYWAIVQGGPEADSGSIDASLLKVTDTSGWRVMVSDDGKQARTWWRVLGRSSDAAWMEFRPSTGRTHQIRVHAAHLGCPILGDPPYGGPEGALQLLARGLTLPMYQGRPPVKVEAELPAHMQDMFRHHGFVAPMPLASPTVP